MTQKQIKDCMKSWQQRLFLQGWVIEVEFVDHLPGKQRNKAGSKYCAETEIDFSYLLSTIFIAKETIDSIQEVDLIHELLHIQLSPLTEFAVDNMSGDSDKDFFSQIEDQTVTLLSRAMVR